MIQSARLPAVARGEVAVRTDKDSKRLRTYACRCGCGHAGAPTAQRPEAICARARGRVGRPRPGSGGGAWLRGPVGRPETARSPAGGCGAPARRTGRDSGATPAHAPVGSQRRWEEPPPPRPRPGRRDMRICAWARLRRQCKRQEHGCSRSPEHFAARRWETGNGLTRRSSFLWHVPRIQSIRRRPRSCEIGHHGRLALVVSLATSSAPKYLIRHAKYFNKAADTRRKHARYWMPEQGRTRTAERSPAYAKNRCGVPISLGRPQPRRQWHPRTAARPLIGMFGLSACVKRYINIHIFI